MKGCVKHLSHALFSAQSVKGSVKDLVAGIVFEAAWYKFISLFASICCVLVRLFDAK